MGIERQILIPFFRLCCDRNAGWNLTVNAGISASFSQVLMNGGAVGAFSVKLTYLPAPQPNKFSVG
jgi:hypothetical protein